MGLIGDTIRLLVFFGIVLAILISLPVLLGIGDYYDVGTIDYELFFLLGTLIFFAGIFIIAFAISKD